MRPPDEFSTDFFRNLLLDSRGRRPVRECRNRNRTAAPVIKLRAGQSVTARREEQGCKDDQLSHKGMIIESAKSVAIDEEIYSYALRLLRGRDYTVSQLSQKLEAKFGKAPPEVIEHLLQKKFLNDRRYAQNYVAKRKHYGALQVREELSVRGVPQQLAEEILAETGWPSLREALTVKMVGWNLRRPLNTRDATRLFRALFRLGYDEDAIREEINKLEQ
jgi:SOS response regulatory protein OraA/RecX